MSLMNMLRGPSKSLRTRFLTNPLNVAKYTLAYKGLGRSRLDYWADATDQAQISRLDDSLGETYAKFGREQFEYLKAKGLSPTHTFLDYGCGPMRGGIHIVPFLSDGLYVGADISRIFMQRGVRLLEHHGIQRKSYHLVTIRDFDVTDLYGFSFDMAASFSALQYLNNEDLTRMLRGLSTRMNGPFLFDFPAPDKRTELAIKHQHYRTPDTVRQICETAGFDTEIIAGYSEAPVARLVRKK